MSEQTLPTGTWTIDGTHSEIEFSVKHLMISKVKGKFTNFTGTITTVADNLDGLKVVGSADTHTIDTNDENRDNHLRSADFFDAETFPTIDFTSTGIKNVKKDKWELSGDLTLHGVTKPVTFDLEFGGLVVDGYGQTKIAAEASTKISRGAFGLTWNTALETGGVLVSDDVVLTVDVQAVLQA